MPLTNSAPTTSGIAGDRVTYNGGPVRLDAGGNGRVSDPNNPGFDVERVGSGFTGGILDLAPVPDGSGRVFVAEKAGRIFILDPATGAKTLFLDISGSVSTGGEDGLVGFVTAPDFATSGRFFVYATNLGGDNEIRQYSLSSNRDVGDAASGNVILTIPHPDQNNHNGGWLGFGPDGMLYVGTGDGGGGGDPNRNAQNPASLLGKILRIDVSQDAFPNDPGRDYAIPADNPYAGGGGRGEVWAIGLRNPFRNSFDTDGSLYIADVGQGAWEEVDRMRPGERGTNFGWSQLEGTHTYYGGDTTGLTPPVLEYGHGGGPRTGFSVTGGYVYRGPVEALQGKYIFADFVTANIWAVPVSAMVPGATIPASAFELLGTAFAPDTGRINQISSFGLDQAGNLYILDYADGEIYRVVASAQTNFAGGSLTVAINGDEVVAEDRLQIDVSAQSGVTLSNGTAAGSEVRIGGVLIGKVATGGSGAGGQDLVIEFSSGATEARVDTLIHALTYANTGATPTAGTRTIVYTLVDGAGAANGGSDRVTFASSVFVPGYGDANNNDLAGTSGGDLFYLQQGGDDRVRGGDGNDAFYFGAALTSADIVAGGGGNDQLGIQGDYTGARSLTLGDVADVEALILLTGSDTRFGDTAGASYSYEVTTSDANVAPGGTLIVDANRLRPGENVRFNGAAETNGSFFVYAGQGVDSWTGGAGNDVFLFRTPGGFTPADRIAGGGGTQDQIGLRGDYAGPNAVVFDANTIQDIEGIVVISGADTRFGPALGVSYSYDLTLNDANLTAGRTMTIDAGTLRTGETLRFNGSGETDGAFLLFGGQGNDVLIGGRGSDMLRGNVGADVLDGGAGADVFRYQFVAESDAAGRDTIVGFAPGSDRIDLSRIDANSRADGNQAFTFIGSAAFSPGVAGQLRVYQDGGSWFVEGDVDGDGVADLIIQVNTDGQPLTGNDFTF